jgi:Ala-tRNA(Pro) deacylase
MNRNEVLALLKELEIPYERTDHPAVFTMEEVRKIDLPYPDAIAKNLFVRDDRRRQYSLITVRGDKRVDLKEFRRKLGTRPLSLASADDLFTILKLAPGSVTPLGLLSTEEPSVVWYLDEDFFRTPKKIGVHPNDNTSTLWFDPEDLIRLLEERASAVRIVSL